MNHKCFPCMSFPQPNLRTPILLSTHTYLFDRSQTQPNRADKSIQPQPHWLPGDKYQWLWPQAWSEISTCWQLSSLPLQGQGTHLPRGPCDLPSENFVKCVICKTFFLEGYRGIILYKQHIESRACWRPTGSFFSEYTDKTPSKAPPVPKVSIMASGALFTREAAITCRRF